MYSACYNLIPRNSEQVSIRASTHALVSLFSMRKAVTRRTYPRRSPSL